MKAKETPVEILQRVKDEVLGKSHTNFVDWRTGIISQEDIDKIALKFHDAMIELSNK